MEGDILKKIIIFILSLFLIFVLFITIDFVNVNFNNRPFFAFKHEDKEKQLIMYNCMFYRVIECTSEENNFTIISYFDNIPANFCPRKINVKFIDGYYTNSKGVKISEEDFFRLHQFYTAIQIDDMDSKDIDEKLLEINNY